MSAPNCSSDRGVAVGLGQRQLPHHVVHVRLGLDEQVGGDVTEDDGVAPLRGRGRSVSRPASSSTAWTGLQRVVDAGRTELGPHDLAALVDRDAPTRAQGFHQQDAATGHVAGAAVGADAVFGHWRREPRRARVRRYRSPTPRSGRTPCWRAFASSSAVTTMRVVDDVARTTGEQAGRGRSGGRRARSPARRPSSRVARSSSAFANGMTSLRAAAELAVSGRVRSCAEGYPSRCRIMCG